MKSLSLRTLPVGVTSSAARSTSVLEETSTTTCGTPSGALEPFDNTWPMRPPSVRCPGGPIQPCAAVLRSDSLPCRPANERQTRDVPPEPCSASGPDAALALVEAHLLTVFGQDSERAGVTFLGAGRIDVLRFGPDPDGLVRYVTVGASREPMTAASASVVDPGGPRAELVLSLHGLHDEVLKPLAALASSPAVEGVVIPPGASLDIAEPVWAGA